MRRTNIYVIVALGLTGLVAAGRSTGHAAAASGEGLKLYKEACQGCHKWHGGGGGGYGGAALSLRQTQLDREQIAEVIACGRPGTGMPSHKRDAYADGSCYGLKKADLGKDVPPEANRFFRPREIEAVADYVMANVKGKGEPDLADCQAYWGEQSRNCEEYRQGSTGGKKDGG